MAGPVRGLRLATLLLRARNGAGAASGAVRRASGEGHGSVTYRQFPVISRYQKIVSETLMGFMWFWILWHFWHSPEEVLFCEVGFAEHEQIVHDYSGNFKSEWGGHFPYPDASKWTDEELGIPPDDE